MLAWINIAEEHQMAQQYAPVGPEAMNQMPPIQFLCAALKNMRNVAAIEPLAFHNVSLHPNHFLGCAKFHLQAK